MNVEREHLAGLLLVDELDGTVAISELIAQAAAAPEQGPEFPSGAIHNGHVFLDQVEQLYQFKDEHGHSLANCSDWQEARRCFEHLAGNATNHADPSEVDRLRVELSNQRANTIAQIDAHSETREQLFAATQRADAAERKLEDLEQRICSEAYKWQVHADDVTIAQHNREYFAKRACEIRALLSASAEPAKGGDGEAT